MFSEHIKPQDVLHFVYDSMLSVLSRMIDLGFPPNLTPPHTASVYVVVDTDDSNHIAIGRSEPYLLTTHNRQDWSVIGLHNLDCTSSDHQIPLGCFLGTVMSEKELGSEIFEKSFTPSSTTSYFVGILISPQGSESIGCYAKLDDLKNPSTFEEDPLTYTAFNFLSSFYTSIEDSDKTIH
jgi:hypothetical protein